MSVSVFEANSAHAAPQDDSPSWLNPRVRHASGWTPPKWSQSSIRLDLNENQLIDQVQLDSLYKKLAGASFHQYPCYDEIVETLASHVGVAESEILLTNGADQAIEIIIRSLNPNGKAILVVPAFSYYQHVLEIEGVNVEKVSYNGDLSFDVEGVLAAIGPDTNAVLLTSPSNPLATEISEAELRMILAKAKTYNALVVVDEVYAAFTGESFDRLIPDYDNLALIKSLSKYHGLAALRVGFISSTSQIINQFAKVRGPWDISGFSANFANLAMKSQSWVSYLETLADHRQKLTRLLEGCGASVFPSRVNFLVFAHPEASRIECELRESGVIVAPLSAYPDGNGLLYNCIRMSVPNQAQLAILETVI